MGFSVYLLLGLEAALALWLLLRAGSLRDRRTWALSVLLLALAFAARAYVFDYETLDYQNFLSKWVGFFRENGHFRAMRYSVGNYNIPYLYFLALFSLLPIRDLYLIKLLSTLFDVLLAWGAMKLLSRYTKKNALLLACFFTVLCLPTVFLNSAVWAQCDSSYAALLVIALWLALDDRPVPSMACAALAFGFKLQAVFVLPVFAVLWMAGKFKWRHFLIFPAVYVLLVLPAVLLGRPFWETVTLYFSQTGSIGSALNYNSSSVFAILWKIPASERVSKIAVAAAFCYMLFILGLCFFRRRDLSDRAILAAAVLLAVGIPFLLPHMHERYFFCADILSVVLAFAAWPCAAAALLCQFASLLGYHAYLKMRFLLPMRCGAAALIVTLAIAALFLFSSMEDAAEARIAALHRKKAQGTGKKKGP
ncbi:MAG: DUF2029 domain-containing protein [Oscillospiraceae bacterium]|nr:DUF2029 domain-containing protein [Oscillospiraceae bacterium]